MELSTALAAADTATLLMVVTQLTGDTSLLDRLRAAIDVPGTSPRLTECERDELRARALEAIPAVQGGARALPPLPSTAVLLDMMSVSAGEVVPPEYLPLLLEEAAFDGHDARAFRWRLPPDRTTLERFHVVVVGAGMSGICAGIRLAEAGIPFTIIERGDDLGGTWRDNRYPGCGVDTPNHLYCYSFAPSATWPRYFSRRDDILDYFRGQAESHGVLPQVRYGTEVIGTAYDDATRWSVRLRQRDGSESTLRADAIISAVGLLNRPSMPDIPGLDSFTGPSFHSARWPEGFDISGRRVAVVGTGASAFQIIPAIADAAEQVSVFQRSAPWVLHDPTYHREVDAAARWLFEHVPYYASWYRFRMLWRFGDRVHAALQHDPAWPHQDRAVSAANDRLREQLVAHLERELDGRPDLIDAVTPRYPPYGKRMLIDNHWYATLRRDDVRLVTTPIAAVEPTGVRTADGELHAADVIVYATGFDAGKVLAPMAIRGRSGTLLHERWGDSPRAFLGITVPDFPNLFCLYGPNTNLAHGGSAIFNTECQVGYAMACLRMLIEQGASAIECREEAHDEYNRRVDAANEQMPWSHPAVANWFKNADGRIVTNSPWRIVDYWAMTREPDFSDYVVHAASPR